MTKRLRSLLWRYGIAILAFTLPVLLSYSLQKWQVYFDPTWVLIVLLVVVAWVAGRGPGLLFAVLIALTLSYYAPPPFKLKFDLAALNRLALFTVLVIMTSARRKAEKVISVRARQQKALVEFGLRALAGSAQTSASSLLDEAAVFVARHLEVEYASVWRLPSGDGPLQLQSSVGWEDNAANNTLTQEGNASLRDYLLPSDGPLVFTDLRKESSNPLPSLLSNHKVVSGASVLIPGVDRPFGVLSAHSTTRREFTPDELNFLQSIANILAETLGRYRREMALHESREWLQVALGSIGDAVIATDLQGRVTYLNAVASTLTGWTVEDAQGQRLPEVFHIVNEYTRLEVENPVSKVLSEGRVIGLANHTLLIAKNGAEFLIDDSGSPIRDDNGAVMGVILIFRDVTARKRTEDTLLAEKLFTGSLVDSLPGIFYLINDHDRFLRWNKNFESVTGYSDEEISVLSPLDLFDGRDRPLIAERIQEGFLRGETAVEAEILTRGGERIPYYLTGRRITVDHAPCLVIIGIDIGQRRQAEMAQAYLAAIIESSEDAVIAKNLDGIITSWNASAERLYNYTAAEAVGSPIQLLIPPDHFDEEPLMLARIRQGERIEHYETVRMKKDGTIFPVSLTVSPIRDKNGHIIGASKIVRDISRKKEEEVEREAMLKREQAARAEAEANQRRSAFLAQASELLSSSLDYEATLKSVARLVVPQFADWCGVDVIKEGGTIQRVTVAHEDPAKAAFAEELSRHYPSDPNDRHGLSNVLRTGQASLYPEITDSQLAQGARDAEHLDLLRLIGLKSAMIVPLVARGRTLGAITFVASESERHYSEQDLHFAQDLADRAALAVDNARLYYEAEVALREREQAVNLHRNVEERLSILVEASNTLLGSMQLEEVQRAVLSISGRLIAADAYAVWRKDLKENSWRIASAIGLSTSFQETVLRDGEGGSSTLLEKPLVVEAVQDVAALKDRFAAYQLEGIQSMLVIPLKLHGEKVGTIAFYYHQPTRFSEIEVRVATALANLAAAAISTTELYQQQIELRAQAEEANRHKDEFLATLSHELRSPLNSIAGNAEILLRVPDIKEIPIVQKAAETIHRNTVAQAQLINDLLDLSRLQTGKLAINKQPVRLSSAIRDSLDSVRLDAAAKAIHIELNLTEDTLTVDADPVRLEQVIWNLLSNAVKFTPKGGLIGVELTRRDKEAVLKVKDDGQGIDTAFLPYVFDMFRQADARTTRRHGGLGIGLALVKQITELHGGRVEVDSEGVGKGACFTLRLPLNDYPALSLDADPAVSDGQLQGMRLLVVDDMQDSVDMMRILLELEGASVTAVMSGAQALKAAENMDFDLLISDISMPGMDGYELLRRLRAEKRFSDLPAIALTGFGREEDVQRAQETGFTTHLTKPVDFDVFMKVVTGALHRRN